MLDDAGAFMARVLEASSHQHLICASPEGGVLAANAATLGIFHLTGDEIAGRSVFDLVTAPDARALRERLASPARDPAERFLLNFVDPAGMPVTLACCLEVNVRGFILIGEPAGSQNCRLEAEIVALTNEMSLITRESTRKSRELEAAKLELTRALDVLQSSYWHMSKTQEVLPLCMACERVKSSDHGWQQVAQFLKDHASFLSHGYCPDCAADLRKQWEL